MGAAVPQLGDGCTPDANGFPDVGAEGAEITLTGSKALVRSLGILGTCIAQAPEFVTPPATEPTR